MAEPVFQDAVTTASAFTQPVIVSTLLESGTTGAGIGSFIVVNSAGWILTCAHMLALQKQFDVDQLATQAYDAEVARIESDASLTSSKRKTMAMKVPRNPNWLRQISYWWGPDGGGVQQWCVDEVADIALGKLEPFKPLSPEIYPTFGNAAKPIRPGASLCRLGFPLHEVACTWDPASRSFTIPPEAFPLPRFPLEGMYTRDPVLADPSGRRIKYLETSSPGLKGQSGGPIFDRDGRVGLSRAGPSAIRSGSRRRQSRDRRQ